MSSTSACRVFVAALRRDAKFFQGVASRSAHARRLNYFASTPEMSTTSMPDLFVPTGTAAQSKEEPPTVEETFKNILPDELVSEDNALENLDLSAETLRRLKLKGVESLFPIQAKCFEPIRNGKDVLARAKTGSGKTIAFGLPLIENLLAAGNSRGMVQALVVVPTRELAKQVGEELATLSDRFSVTCVYGGAAMNPQLESLRRGTDIVVGTPGRICDFLDKGALHVGHLKTLILDEADHMLDKGFEEEMESILKFCPEERQTLMFSATMPPFVNYVSHNYLKDHITVDLLEGEEFHSPTTIEHFSIRCSIDEKFEIISEFSLRYHNKKQIIFVPRKIDADKLGELPQFSSAEILHGDINQAAREISLKRFKTGQSNVLIATDVAARGLDIPNVDVVFQSDVPHVAEQYLHRAGRCGRAGKHGMSIMLVAPSERQQLRAISSVDFQPIHRPSRSELIETSVEIALQKMEGIGSELDEFLPAAEKVFSEDPARAQKLVAAALTTLSGRGGSGSILGGKMHQMTVELKGTPNHPVTVYATLPILHRIIGRGKLKTGIVRSTADGAGVVLDLPEELAFKVYEGRFKTGDVEVRLIKERKELPELGDESYDPDFGSGEQRGRGRGRGGYGGRDRGFGGDRNFGERRDYRGRDNYTSFTGGRGRGRGRDRDTGNPFDRRGRDRDFNRDRDFDRDQGFGGRGRGGRRTRRDDFEGMLF